MLSVIKMSLPVAQSLHTFLYNKMRVYSVRTRGVRYVEPFESL